MAKKFGKTEKYIQEQIEKTGKFTYQGDAYELLKIGKPNPKDGKGEPKTDIYCLARKKVSGKEKEFKISVKQTNANFLENKMSLERAIDIFGEDAQEIISRSTQKLKSEFEGKSIFIEKGGRTEKGAITIGWKFELLNVLSGKKSGKIELTNEQKIDVYVGTNIKEEKRNSKVNGEDIDGSGIANYILEVDKDALPSLDEIFKCIEPIEEYAKEQNVYFACKAINFRSSKMKERPKPWDGNRPLAVYIDWKLNGEKISYDVMMDNPLGKKADEIGFQVIEMLKELGIKYDNFEEIENYVENKDIING